jgi:alkyl hydroperoxide reductase subunit AhpC
LLSWHVNNSSLFLYYARPIEWIQKKYLFGGETQAHGQHNLIESRGSVKLSQYVGKKNVVISFVPAAWTPICSDQWPGYNIAKDIFDKNDAILLGITVDNIPTLYAWTQQMTGTGDRLWFPVLSDFFPHGYVAKKYGVLRSQGVSERALFIINKQGIISYIDVHDINHRPPLEDLAQALEKLN